MPKLPKQNTSNWAVTLGLLMTGIHCLAVDPPPSWILNAPSDEQLRYANTVGKESERLRSKVARQRFVEKQEVKQAFAAGLERELQTQRELLAPSGATAGQAADLAAATGEAVGSNYLAFLGVALTMLALYRFRDRIFSWFEKTA